MLLAEELDHNEGSRRVWDAAGIGQGLGCGRVSGLAGVCEGLFALPDMGTFPQKQPRGHMGRAGAHTEGLAPLSAHPLLCHSPELGWEPGLIWGGTAVRSWYRREKRSPVPGQKSIS